MWRATTHIIPLPFKKTKIPSGDVVPALLPYHASWVRGAANSAACEPVDFLPYRGNSSPLPFASVDFTLLRLGFFERKCDGD